MTQVDSEKDVLEALASWIQAQPQRTCMFQDMFGERMHFIHHSVIHSFNHSVHTAKGTMLRYHWHTMSCDTLGELHAFILNDVLLPQNVETVIGT